jgi:hypothetical protein
MQAIVAGSHLFPSSVELANVQSELAELGRCDRLQPLTRQRLLQIIHASRALDTSLTVVMKHNALPPAFGIGKMLWKLSALPAGAQGRISVAARKTFISAISDVRNRYAHHANAFPNSNLEVDRLMSETEACLSVVL